MLDVKKFRRAQYLFLISAVVFVLFIYNNNKKYPGVRGNTVVPDVRVGSIAVNPSLGETTEYRGHAIVLQYVRRVGMTTTVHDLKTNQQGMPAESKHGACWIFKSNYCWIKHLFS